MKRLGVGGGAVCLLNAGSLAANAADWSQWRGEKRDGHIAGFKNPAWTKTLDSEQNFEFSDHYLEVPRKNFLDCVIVSPKQKASA